MSDRLTLGVPGYSFADLFAPARLFALDADFRRLVATEDAALGARYEAWREGEALAPEPESELLLAVAPKLAGFVAKLFGIERQWRVGYDEAARAEAWLRFKDEFVKRRAAKRTSDHPRGCTQRRRRDPHAARAVAGSAR